jgi:hypothetical protein
VEIVLGWREGFKRKQVNIKNAHIDSAHIVHYAIEGMPTAAWTSDSLLGLARLSDRIPSVLAAAYGGERMPKVELYVYSVAAGSLTDNVIVRLMFGSEAAMNSWIVKVRQATGIEGMQNRHPLVGPVLTGLIVFGSAYAAVRMAGRENGTNGSVVNLNKCSNNIVQLGASQLHMDSESYATLLRDHAGNRFNIASNACRVLSPVRQSGGDFTIDADANLVIPAAAVREVPPRIDRAAEPPQVQAFDNTEVNIRALDLDSRTKGWAVMIPSICGKRLKLEIDSGLSPDIVTGGVCRADLNLYYSQTEDGDRIYKLAVLRAIRK